jgi:glycosyltransferase involved in cell wall biosynthesis
MVLHPKDIIGCTIVSRNYLAQARTAAQSFMEHHPGCRFVVLLADENRGMIDPKKEAFELMELPEVAIPELRQMAFYYGIVEFNTAVKPFFLEKLFSKYSPEAVIYIDPDTMFFHPATTLLEALSTHDLVLTPHMREGVDDGKRPTEQAIQWAGIYNLGFGAFRKGLECQKLLTWWKERLTKRCLIDVQQALFVDQRWMDFAPGFVERTKILRDPTYNVAYWNLHERMVEKIGGQFTVNDTPLVFYHFSGFRPEAPDVLSKHQSRLQLKDHPGLQTLFALYATTLRKHGYETTCNIPYAFGMFDDGTPIPHIVRRIYLRLNEKIARSFGDPFHTGKGSFFKWLNTPSVEVQDKRITNLLHAIRMQPSDCDCVFPEGLGNDVRLIDWIRYEHGAEGLRLPEVFVAHCRASVARSMKRTAQELLRTRHEFTPYQWLCRTVKRIIGRERFRSLQRTFGVRRSSDLARSTPSVQAIGGVNVIGYLDDNFGVSEICRGILRGLEASTIPTTITSVQQQATSGPRVRWPISGLTYNTNLIHLNANEFPQYSSVLGSDCFHGRRTIGYWCWELPEFPRPQHAAFAHVHEVWTLSSFCQRSIAQVSPVPVITMWPSIDVMSHGGPPDRTRFGLPSDRFIVLFVFNPMSVTERKNPLGLVKAFEKAFSGRRDVLLVIAMPHAELFPEEARAVREALARVGGILRTESMDHTTTLSLIQCADCYASLHRSEGFGLTIAEAIALGVPTIATDFSGNTDFMPANLTERIPYTLTSIKKSLHPYPAGATWADPDLDAAAHALRKIHGDPTGARARAAAAKEMISAQLSPMAVGRRIQERLMHLPE